MFHLFFGIEKALFELIEKHDETPVKNVTKRLFMKRSIHRNKLDR